MRTHGFEELDLPAIQRRKASRTDAPKRQYLCSQDHGLGGGDGGNEAGQGATMDTIQPSWHRHTWTGSSMPALQSEFPVWTDKCPQVRTSVGYMTFLDRGISSEASVPEQTLEVFGRLLVRECSEKPC